MVRHYVPKHKAWRPYLWTGVSNARGVYVPEYKEKIRTTPEPEILTPIRSMDGEIKAPGSREEWRVSQALDYFSQPYYFQYSIAGGKRVRGGQVIDFYVDTVPQPTLVWVQGTYWHKNQADRELLISQAVSLFDNEVRSVEIWDYEVPTIDDAIQIIKQRVM